MPADADTVSTMCYLNPWLLRRSRFGGFSWLPSGFQSATRVSSGLLSTPFWSRSTFL